MRNAILRQLQAEYEQLRLRNAQEEDRRRQEVIAACPEIARLLDDRENMIFSGLRSILDGAGRAEDMTARMDVTNRRVRDLLRQHGFPEDYL